MAISPSLFETRGKYRESRKRYRLNDSFNGKLSDSAIGIGFRSLLWRMGICRQVLQRVEGFMGLHHSGGDPAYGHHSSRPMPLIMKDNSQFP